MNNIKNLKKKEDIVISGDLLNVFHGNLHQKYPKRGMDRMKELLRISKNCDKWEN